MLIAATWFSAIINTLVLVLGILLIFIILIQRGKGGGLAGALGGVGGSSAFGTRAGDQFTRITVYVALFWIFLIMFTIKVGGSATEVGDQQQSEGPGSQTYHHPADGGSGNGPAAA